MHLKSETLYFLLFQVYYLVTWLSLWKNKQTNVEYRVISFCTLGCPFRGKKTEQTQKDAFAKKRSALQTNQAVSKSSHLRKLSRIIDDNFICVGGWLNVVTGITLPVPGRVRCARLCCRFVSWIVCTVCLVRIFFSFFLFSSELCDVYSVSLTWTVVTALTTSAVCKALRTLCASVQLFHPWLD